MDDSECFFSFSSESSDSNKNETVLGSASTVHSWMSNGVIELPTKFFEFIALRKNKKGFVVKFLKCHEFKTAYNKKGKVELLSITTNSVYNAKRHMQVPYFPI